jgi:hypothetical protein
MEAFVGADWHQEASSLGEKQGQSLFQSCEYINHQPAQPLLTRTRKGHNWSVVVIQPHDGTMVLYDSVPRNESMFLKLIKECVRMPMDIWETEGIARCTTQIDNECSALFLLLNVVAYFGHMEHPFEMYNSRNLPALRKWLVLALIKKEVKVDDRIYRP